MMAAQGKIWKDWFPEAALADVLSGADVVVNIGQVEGAFKTALDKEVRAGRLTTWRGHWYPVAGAPWGLGPLKKCWGRHEIKRHFDQISASCVEADRA